MKTIHKLKNSRTGLFLYNGKEYNKKLSRSFNILYVLALAIAMTVACTVFSDIPTFILTALAIVEGIIFLVCLGIAFEKEEHEQKEIIANAMLFIRKEMRKYGYGNQNGFIYKQPASVEDWECMLRESIWIANLHYKKDANSEQNTFLRNVARYAPQILERKHMM